MKISINNKATETSASTVNQLAAELHLPAAGVALAVNNKMVPRTEWSQQSLQENDQVVIIKAVCGG